MQRTISDELFKLIYTMEASIANVLGHPECPEAIKEKLSPVWIEMNTPPTCEVFGFRTLVEELVDDDEDDDGDDGGEEIAA